MPVTGGTRKFLVPQTIKYFPIYGTYKGVRVSKPKQEIFVSLIDTFKFIPAFPGWSLNLETYRRAKIIRNLTYPNFSISDFAPDDYYSVVSPKATYINQPNGTRAQDGLTKWPGFVGYAWLEGREKIHIDYQYEDTLTGKWIKDYFTGTRVQ
jgi:hypothetical protein